MTDSEFNDWLKYHFSRFTGAASWLAKFPAISLESGAPTQKSVIDGWRDTLRTSNYEHSKTASHRLAAGEESFLDRGYDCHPMTVRAIAAKLSGQQKSIQKPRWKIVDDEEVFSCGACRDTGIVVLWHPSALRFFKREFADSPPEDWTKWFCDPRWRERRRSGQVYESCVVLCNCDRGMLKRSNMPRYDDSRHVLFGSGDPRKAIDDFALTPSGGYGLSDEF